MEMPAPLNTFLCVFHLLTDLTDSSVDVTLKLVVHCVLHHVKAVT